MIFKGPSVKAVMGKEHNAQCSGSTKAALGGSRTSCLLIKLPKSLLEKQKITGNKSVSDFLLATGKRENGLEGTAVLGGEQGRAGAGMSL